MPHAGSRLLAVAALTFSLGTGVVGAIGEAHAAPGAPGSHARAVEAKDQAKDQAKGKLAQKQKWVHRTATRLDRQLAHVVRDRALEGLTEDDATAVRNAVTSDRAEIAHQDFEASQATTMEEIAPAVAALKQVKVSRQVRAVVLYRRAATDDTAIAEARAGLAEGDTDGAASLDQAEADVAAARAALSGVSAFGSADALREAQGDLQAAEALLEQVTGA